MAALIHCFRLVCPLLIVPCGGINYPYFTQAPGLIVPWDGTIREKLQFSGLGIMIRGIAENVQFFPVAHGAILHVKWIVPRLS